MKKAFWDALASAIVPKAELHYTTALDLLVAVVLSAQCTDKAVNKVTEQLWRTVRTADDYIALGEEKLRGCIHSIGFHTVKARHIIGLCCILREKYNGEVPSTREELMELPGVGRKTANVVLNLWFRQPVIAVDTHVGRVSRRTGLSSSTTPDGVEADLMRAVPEKYLADAHHYLLLLGRYICRSQNPQCQSCPVAEWCPSSKNGKDKKKVEGK